MESVSFLNLINKEITMEANKILKADILDIIFEGKNKSYGAYELRKTYNKRLTRALIITGGISLIGLSWHVWQLTILQMMATKKLKWWIHKWLRSKRMSHHHHHHHHRHRSTTTTGDQPGTIYSSQSCKG